VAAHGGGRADVRKEVGDAAADIFAVCVDEGEEVARETDEYDADEELDDPGGDVDGLAPVVCELLHGGGGGGWCCCQVFLLICQVELGARVV